MRIEITLATVGTLLFAAGCADTPRQTYYGTDTIHGGQVMSSSTYPNSTYSSTTDSTYPSANAPLTPTYSLQGGDFDRDLAERVRRELNRYNDLSACASSIEITAQNGAVSLAGSVPTEGLRNRIHSITRNTAGVLAVNDQLQIAPPPSPTYSVAPTPAYTSSYTQSSQSDQSLANQVQQGLYSH